MGPYGNRDSGAVAGRRGEETSRVPGGREEEKWGRRGGVFRTLGPSSLELPQVGVTGRIRWICETAELQFKLSSNDIYVVLRNLQSIEFKMSSNAGLTPENLQSMSF